jgi:single-stranded DNA-specific DHH superfamily exonuclease
MKFVRKTSYDIRNNYAKNLFIDRGILTKRQVEEGASWYFSPTKENLCNPYDLDHMEEALDLFFKHVNNNSRIRFYVDCDVDGFTSSAVLINYMQDVILPDHPDV